MDSVQMQPQVQVRVDFASDVASSSSSKETLPLSDQWLHPSSPAAHSADRSSAVDWRTVCVALEHNFHLNVPSDDPVGTYQTRMSSRSAEHLNAQPGGRRESSPSGSRNRSVKYSPHQRSQSVRSAKRPNHYLSPPPPPSRPRGTSLPGAGAGPGGGSGSDDDYYLLRQFVVSGKNKVVNRGDSFRNRRARESSGNSSASSISTENVAGSPPMTTAAGDWFSSSARPSSVSQSHGPSGAPLRVLILGASGVGKTALTAQFMTSEYLNTYDASLDEDSCARSVSVLLDGEESELVFIDHPHGEISVENCISTYNPQAYVVVYSVVDVESLAVAEDLLHFLWRSDVISTHAVILVGNKIDLVRSRCVSSQGGKSLAASFDCKFIETSSGMQHNVDELLVGILKQIRLKLGDPDQARSLFRKRSSRRKRGGGGGGNNSGGVRSTSLRVRGLLGKVWCADRNKSRSCEDLHVL